MEAVKGFARIPHHLIRALGLSAHAFRVAMLLMDYADAETGKPAYPSWEHLMLITGFGRGRLSKAIQELESKRIIRVERSCKPNLYYIRPVDEWSVKAYTAESKIVPNRNHHSSESELSTVPNQNSIKNKRLRLTDSVQRGKVVTKTTNHAPQGLAAKNSGGDRSVAILETM